jgi:hypothetical protein
MRIPFTAIEGRKDKGRRGPSRAPQARPDQRTRWAQQDPKPLRAMQDRWVHQGQWAPPGAPDDDDAYRGRQSAAALCGDEFEAGILRPSSPGEQFRVPERIDDEAKLALHDHDDHAIILVVEAGEQSILGVEVFR